MDQHLAYYICRYYGHFMTDRAKLAGKHLSATEKSTKGRSDLAAQEEAKHSPIWEDLLSSDPIVLELARQGMASFIKRTAERILAEHANEIYVNRCPRCGEVAKTPKARQCRFCYFDWHLPANG